MGHKIFISYKYKDSNVKSLDENDTTVRDYVDKLQDYIEELTISEADQALILVGKNNTGKTSVLDAIRLAMGHYDLKTEDFLYPNKNIIIDLRVELSESDLQYYVWWFHMPEQQGMYFL